MRDADERGHHDVMLLDQLRQLGLAAMRVEQSDPVSFTVMLEEFGYGDASAALAVATVVNAIGLIADRGNSDQRQWAAALASGTMFVPVVTALCEPGFGADHNAPNTKAEPEELGGYRLHGTKAMVPLASSA